MVLAQSIVQHAINPFRYVCRRFRFNYLLNQNSKKSLILVYKYYIQPQCKELLNFFLITMSWTQLMAKMRSPKPVIKKQFRCSLCKRYFDKIENVTCHIIRNVKCSSEGASIEDLTQRSGSIAVVAESELKVVRTIVDL